jgi:hypothetical protein
VTNPPSALRYVQQSALAFATPFVLAFVTPFAQALALPFVPAFARQFALAFALPFVLAFARFSRSLRWAIAFRMSNERRACKPGPSFIDCNVQLPEAALE